tara:strand:- start:371 stop:658 length:288 start_codon:yes stop_codon:yes gene_type:complete
MSDNITTIIITIVSVTFGAGAWKFYEFLIRNKREKQKEDKSEQTIFRDSLITRVDKLESEKEECKCRLLDISTELASLKTKIEFIERENDRLRYK